MAAIYCPPWPKNIVVTTTIYPVDYADGVAIGCGPSTGWMAPIATDQLATDQAIIGMTYIQERWYLPTIERTDDIATGQAIISMTYVQQRWYLPTIEETDNLSTSQVIIGMTKIYKLVEADTPDEMIGMNATIMNTCTMDAI